MDFNPIDFIVLLFLFFLLYILYRWIEDNMFVVWYCKTLQNWKALVGCIGIDEYVEVTYNGNNGETYVDIYNKALNVAYNKETVAEIMKYVI